MVFLNLPKKMLEILEKSGLCAEEDLKIFKKSIFTNTPKIFEEYPTQRSTWDALADQFEKASLRWRMKYHVSDDLHGVFLVSSSILHVALALKVDPATLFGYVQATPAKRKKKTIEIYNMLGEVFLIEITFDA